MIYLSKTCWVIDMLYVFLEGPDDERYFSKVIFPFLEACSFVRYANMQNAKVNNFIQTIDQNSSWDYIFLGDADGKTIEDRKTHLLSKYNKLSAEKIFIVQYEIESWYYSGASEEECRKLKLKHFELNTDTLTKEQFYSKLDRPSDKKYVMERLLDVYSLSLAVTRNFSLNLFSEKINERTCSAVS